MSKLILRNVFVGGIGVVAASAGAMVPGTCSPAKAAEYPDAIFVHKAGTNNGLAQDVSIEQVRKEQTTCLRQQQ